MKKRIARKMLTRELAGDAVPLPTLLRAARRLHGGAPANALRAVEADLYERYQQGADLEPRSLKRRRRLDRRVARDGIEVRR